MKIINKINRQINPEDQLYQIKGRLTKLLKSYTITNTKNKLTKNLKIITRISHWGIKI